MICYSIALFLLQHLVTYCKLPYCRITQSFKYFFFLEIRGRRVGRPVLFILDTKVCFNLKKKTYNCTIDLEREHIITTKEVENRKGQVSTVTVFWAHYTDTRGNPWSCPSLPFSCKHKSLRIPLCHVGKSSMLRIWQIKLSFQDRGSGILAIHTWKFV